MKDLFGNQPIVGDMIIWGVRADSSVRRNLRIGFVTGVNEKCINILPVSGTLSYEEPFGESYDLVTIKKATFILVKSVADKAINESIIHFVLNT